MFLQFPGNVNFPVTYSRVDAEHPLFCLYFDILSWRGNARIPSWNCRSSKKPHKAKVIIILFLSHTRHLPYVNESRANILQMAQAEQNSSLALLTALMATADTFGYQGFVTCPWSFSGSEEQYSGQTLSREACMWLSLVFQGNEFGRDWLVPSRSIPKSEPHLLQTASLTQRGCKCTSIMCIKAIKNSQCSVPHRGATYTQFPAAVRAEYFFLFPTGLAFCLLVSSSFWSVLPKIIYKCTMNCTPATDLYLTTFNVSCREGIISHSSAAGSWTASLMLNLCICEDRIWCTGGKLWSQRENRLKMNLSYILALYDWILNLLCRSNVFMEM